MNPLNPVPIIKYSINAIENKCYNYFIFVLFALDEEERILLAFGDINVVDGISNCGGRDYERG